MTQCKYLAVLPWRSRKRAVELLQPLCRWARVCVPLARCSLTHSVPAQRNPRRGRSVRIQRLLFFFVLCFLFRRTRDRPAGRQTHGRGVQGLQVKQERACACVRPPPLPPPPPPSSSAAASGPMSLMQFWTKFYSQLGRPLPKVPVPFASSASIQTELTNSFVKWLSVTVAVLFFFSIKSLSVLSVRVARWSGSSELKSVKFAGHGFYCSYCGSFSDKTRSTRGFVIFFF